MCRNYTPYDYRAVIVLATLDLFALALLAALLSPSAIPLLAVLTTLVAILRISLKAFNAA